MSNINNTENNNKDISSEDNVIAPINKQTGFSRKLKIAAILCGILAILFGIAYINRTQISETALVNYFNSKKIKSEIKIKRIDADGIEFSSLKLGDKAKETLIINNGKIIWEYGLLKDFIIKDIKADSLDLNLKLTDKGIDFGALAPLMGNKSSGKPIKIRNISLHNAKINLLTEYGSISTKLKINGNLDDGFKAKGNLNAPSKLIKNGENIPIVLSSKGLNDKNKIAIGLNAKLENISILPNNIIKDLSLDNLNSNLNIGYAIHGKKNGIIIKNSSGKFDNLKYGKTEAYALGEIDFEINNANLSFDTGLKNLLISLKDTNINANNFASKTFKASKLGVSGDNLGLLKLYAIDTSGIIAAKGLFINNNLKEPISLDKFNDDLEINIKDLSPNILGQGLGGINNSLKAFGLNELAPLSINTNAKLKYNSEEIEIVFNNPLAAKSLHQVLVFNPKQDFIRSFNGIKISDLKNTPKLKANFAGDLFLNADNTQLKTNIYSLDIENNGIVLNLVNSSLSNLKFQNIYINGNLENTEIISQNGQINGKIIGDLKLNNLNSIPSHLALNADFKGSNLNYSIIGDIKNLKFLDNIIRRGNIKSDGFVSLSEKIGTLNLNINNGDLNAFGANLLGLKSEANFSFNLNNGIALNGNLNAYLDKFIQKEISANNASFSGPISVFLKDKAIAINGKNCLDIGVEKILISGQQINTLNGNICPNNNRFALIKDKTNIYASTNLKPLSIIMGSKDNIQTLVLSDLKGQFSSDNKGNIIYNSDASDFAYKFKYSETDWAIANATNARLNFIIGKGENILNLSMKNAKIDGLPVFVNGDLSGRVNMKQEGLGANLSFENLKIKDKEELPRFGEFEINGSGKLANNIFNIIGDAKNIERGLSFAQIAMYHNLNRGIGAVNIKADKLKFTSERLNGKKIGLELVDLIPPLTGIINESNGIVDASANISWSADKLSSSAIISTDDFDFNAGAGPVEDISGTIKISDILKLKTDGIQKLKVGSFNPGVPIENGEVGFTLDGDNAINLVSAEWPFAEGVLSLVPSKIYFDNTDKELAVKVDRINITQLLRLTKVPNLEIEGIMSGILPIKIQENSIIISGGHLLSDGEGVVRYIGPELTAKQEKSKGFKALKERLFGKPPPPIAELAVEALRNLKYRILELNIDGRLTGEMVFKVLLEGANQSVLSGQPFKFNIKASMPIGDMVNTFKNLSNPNQFQTFDENGNMIFKPELIEKPN